MALSLAAQIFNVNLDVDVIRRDLEGRTAEARYATQQIVLDRDNPRPWTWDRSCLAILHEYGHLSGIFRHSKTPGTIMWPYLDHKEPRCGRSPHGAEVHRG